MNVKDIKRLHDIIKKTYPEINEGSARQMWEQYSYSYNQTWLELSSDDKIIEMELKSSGLYNEYEYERNTLWKIKLADTILEEAIFCCKSTVDVGLSNISVNKDNVGEIVVGDILIKISESDLE